MKTIVKLVDSLVATASLRGGATARALIFRDDASANIPNLNSRQGPWDLPRSDTPASRALPGRHLPSAITGLDDVERMPDPKVMASRCWHERRPS